ncbi:MAG: Hsp70 family protein [Acetobacteraceae bacterium]|nr:Hsp70 family protein [Acetobacteraceae bacterium]
MPQARFSIGIDLGTTNSALAFVPLLGEAKPEILLIAQWETLGSLAEAPTLPSFLYLPEDAVAAQLRGGSAGPGEWVVGRLARRRAGETPGRVIQSAKSWLCHHTADRTAPFLPWGSEDLAREQKISPVRASALILNYLRGAWNDRFAEAGLAFDDQEITVTVPASFDPAAQQLTLAAAREAGFPDGVRLLEEPQAAFYCWLGQHDPARELWQLLAGRDSGPRHVLIVDIGGGTSDFSLFELAPGERDSTPTIRRVAVSEHILLGGDNIDLAIAHLVEPRLAEAQGQLSRGQWDHLIASCRDLKESALSAPGPPDERFAVALPGRGSGLFAGSRVATLTRAEIETVLLEGFLPECDARARPYRTQAALREWGLPYASDSAITRHLADFLRERPKVDAVLFNGGSLHPPLLRQRLRAQIGAWQGGAAPIALENAEPALAVARGAARFGRLLHQRTGRITAGAAQAMFLEVQRPTASGDEAARPALVCILPRGAPPEERFEIAVPALELRTDQPVRFQAYSSSRHGRCRAGEILAWREGDFHALPPLQTIVRTDGAARSGAGRTIPVHLAATMNALGLLQVSCVSADPAIPQSWPLEFNLRPHEQGGVGAVRETAAPVEPNAPADALEAARKHLKTVFTRPPGKVEKASAAAVLKSLERVLGLPRSEWNAALLRALWPALDEQFGGRGISVDHEETWLALAGFLLRPGFGVPHDALRIDGLWRLNEAGPCFPGRRIKSQEYILWRRVAGGLTRERQEKLLAGERDRLRGNKAPAELVRLAGSLELLPNATKVELVNRFIDTAVTLAHDKGHCAPYLAALGLLLSRAPLYAGPETVVSPDLVERAYAAFRDFDWADPELLELQNLFLRAARVVGDRSLDVPAPLRTLIAGKLERAGVAPLRTAKVKAFVAVGRSDRASLYGEALPPGLVLGPGQDDAGG